MSFAEIVAELPKLTPQERTELSQKLKLLEPFDDPEFMAELTRRNREAERGENVVTDEEFRAILRTRGHDV